MRRMIAVLIGTLLLGGCNAVITPTPLFTLADQAGGPAPRLGIWRFEIKSDCAVDESKPIGDWPECAQGLVWKEGGVAGFYDRASGAPVWKVQPLIFAPGTPGIVQAEMNVSGDIKVDGKPSAYAGARATKSDDQGRITALVIWPVLCGPPPPGQADGMTKTLLPGLSAKPEAPVCTTASVAALRNAAQASEAWTPKTISGHWVRDGGS